ncbi:hypothetical protein Taro_001808, partial [Colocasia esculenta]|nr:hypothetical protein [Colocasia esculenta]
ASGLRFLLLLLLDFFQIYFFFNTPLLSPELGLDSHSKCVDTQADCVDTTGYCFKTGFWEGQCVSTHRQTVSTPLAIASEQASGRDSLAGDPTSLEETVESDSERGE